VSVSVGGLDALCNVGGFDVLTNVMERDFLGDNSMELLESVLCGDNATLLEGFGEEFRLVLNPGCLDIDKLFSLGNILLDDDRIRLS
jgi:hypothetical protein